VGPRKLYEEVASECLLFWDNLNDIFRISVFENARAGIEKQTHVPRIHSYHPTILTPTFRTHRNITERDRVRTVEFNDTVAVVQRRAQVRPVTNLDGGMAPDQRKGRRRGADARSGWGKAGAEAVTMAPVPKE